ncbi:MAG: hypothetical protein LBK60_11055 [Verrucomicrobiales bacterium]|jgi:cell division protein FtsZ|nr:hypothetical protein [Verrucomicrobiales bacterium]
MINFKSDGEFQAPEAASLAGHAIIGLGSAGVNVVDQIMLDRRDGEGLLGFDTDGQVMRGSVLDEKMLLGAGKIHGLGTGGDPALAAELAREERLEISGRLQGLRSAVLVAGLGGGTGGGMAPEFCRMLKQLGAAVVVVAVTPFAFEGRRRSRQAAEALAALRREADAVLCLSNGRLVGALGREVEVRHIFATMNGLAGRVCLNLRAALNQRGPLQIHLADVRKLLAEHADGGVALENCWVGCGTGSGGERARAAVDEALGSPLFADGQVWARGTAVVACLGGDGNLSMGEVQAALEYLRREMPVELPVLAGTILEPRETAELSLTLLVIGQADAEEEEAPRPGARGELAFAAPPAAPVSHGAPVAEVPAGVAAAPAPPGRAAGHQGTEQRYFAQQQEELPLDQKIYRGRFEKSAPTIFHGEDLDQPTFMRQNIKIRLSS